jgi:hypothetical protein
MIKYRDAVFVEKTRVGNGLFSRVRFERTDIVAEVRGMIIDDPVYESDYCIDLGKHAKLEPQAPYRFLNHCCDPNCELVLWKKRRVGKRKYARVWLQAVRDIAPGEELTIDYAWPAEAAIPCQCASRLCRKWIVHPDELDVLLGSTDAGRSLAS